MVDKPLTAHRWSLFKYVLADRPMFLYLHLCGLMCAHSSLCLVQEQDNFCIKRNAISTVACTPLTAVRYHSAPIGCRPTLANASLPAPDNLHACVCSVPITNDSTIRRHTYQCIASHSSTWAAGLAQCGGRSYDASPQHSGSSAPAAGVQPVPAGPAAHAARANAPGSNRSDWG